MFLFTTPPAKGEPTQTAPESPILRHLKDAAQATGTSFDYLIKTAKRESGLNPTAKAQSSSATGLFQFIEQTWLGLVKREGANVGLAAEAEAIQKDRSGRYVVSDPDQRRQILNLRKDPALASTMAGVFTQKNRDVLKGQLAREPNAGELYMAHFLGAQGAAELISLAESNPAASAARAFPDAASANRSIFFDGKGRARSVREVYARLASFHGGESAAATQVASAAAPAEGVADNPMRVMAPAGPGSIPRLVTSTQPRSNNAIHGLFRGGGDGAGAERLRRTWLNVAESRLRPDAPSFFPRQEPVAQMAALAPEQAKSAVSDAPAMPLPAAIMPAPAAAPAPARGAIQRIDTPVIAKGQPMDLTKFRFVK